MANKYQVVMSNQFMRDYRLASRRGYDMALLDAVTYILVVGGTLPEHYHVHILTGKFTGCYECHLAPDWLLIYKIFESQLILLFMRTGSHSDLFK